MEIRVVFCFFAEPIERQVAQIFDDAGVEIGEIIRVEQNTLRVGLVIADAEGREVLEVRALQAHAPEKWKPVFG
jgi:hypothetical protein